MALDTCAQQKALYHSRSHRQGFPLFHIVNSLPCSKQGQCYIHQKPNYSCLVLALTLTYSLSVIRIANLCQSLHSLSECWIDNAAVETLRGPLSHHSVSPDEVSSACLHPVYLLNWVMKRKMKKGGWKLLSGDANSSFPQWNCPVRRRQGFRSLSVIFFFF